MQREAARWHTCTMPQLGNTATPQVGLAFEPPQSWPSRWPHGSPPPPPALPHAPACLGCTGNLRTGYSVHKRVRPAREQTTITVALGKCCHASHVGAGRPPKHRSHALRNTHGTPAKSSGRSSLASKGEQPLRQVRMVRCPPQLRMQERPVGPGFTSTPLTSTPARFMLLMNSVPHCKGRQAC